MINWRHTLLAGGAIILLANAVALGGAAWNRSGESESHLPLTQRELNARSGHDNSGMTLTLNWRFEQTSLDEYNFGMYSGHWGMPLWLDRAKLVALGFDVQALDRPGEYGRHRTAFEPKEALVVLELDGPAWQRHLQRAQEYVAETGKLLAVSPTNAEMQRKAKNAYENYKHEQDKGSRLFAIDAGLDLATLRATYPDRSRYAIVHGLIRPSSTRIKDKTVLGGFISDLHAEHINVPLRLRQVFEGGSPFEATVAFGQRLEPWLENAGKTGIVKEGKQ
ncbi:MAG TPA: DUF4824 family protein [Sideroxyarcus sp.]|nr:DUF4824 family protein [Sideroxyarcus sp.]